MSDLQTKWRFCVKCSVIFYNGFEGRGSCPADGQQHAPAGLNFQLPHDGPETDHAQRNWQFCRKCFAMHWAPATNQACNLGGRHDPTGSWNFVLPHSTPETREAQSSWRFCRQCSNLFWQPAADQHCTAGGVHAPQGLVFTLPHRADHVYDTGPVTSDLPLGGWAQLTVRPDGSYSFTTHAHDSGADNIEYAFGVVLVNRFGPSFSFGHTGHVEGTSDALPFGAPDRDEQQTTNGSDPRLAAEYDNLADADIFLPPSLIEKDKLASGIDQWLQDLAAQTLAGLGKKAAAAIVEAV
jgi:hypothetical protein